MATKLEKTIKRELEIDGQPYTVTISPEGVKLTQKGFRKGREITWKHLWESGSEEGGGGSTRGAGSGGASAGGGARMNASGAGGGGMGGMSGENR